MTTPLSWLRKLPQAEQQQAKSDFTHATRYAVEKSREELLKRFEELQTAMSSHGEAGRRNGVLVDELVAQIRSEPVKVGK